jgi:hypothetical protein
VAALATAYWQVAALATAYWQVAALAAYWQLAAHLPLAGHLSGAQFEVFSQQLRFGPPGILAGHWQLATGWQLAGAQGVIFRQQLRFGLIGCGRHGIGAPPLL